MDYFCVVLITAAVDKDNTEDLLAGVEYDMPQIKYIGSIQQARLATHPTLIDKFEAHVANSG